MLWSFSRFIFLEVFDMKCLVFLVMVVYIVDPSAVIGVVNKID